ncbi:MAG: hypothetical protein RBR81_06520 [Bacteroidales bacterium]|jgi:hypothetical protein|nr:hypothetical protein [Bacteroidales bacterium]
MKTSKTKTSAGLKSTRGVSRTVKTTKVTSLRHEPGEEEIRRKASEIYNKRVKKGEPGTELGDWLKAEKLLKRS